MTEDSFDIFRSSTRAGLRGHARRLGAVDRAGRAVGALMGQWPLPADPDRIAPVILVKWVRNLTARTKSRRSG